MNTAHNINARDNSRVHVGNVVAPESRSLAALYITDPRLDKERLEKTKGGLLRGSYQWILEHESFTTWRSSECASEPLWIRGDPGKGKTMLLCGIIDELQKATKLAFFFFCEASDSSRSNATAVLRGLLWLLVKVVPMLDSHLRESYDDAGKPLFRDKNAWFALSSILANILKDPRLKGAYFVVDALDECTVERECLLHFITTQASSTEAKWLVSSRNMVDIERHLRKRLPRDRDVGTIDRQSHISLEHAENATYVSEAIAAYISSSIQSLDCLKDDEVLSSKVRDHLQKHAEGTFLWIHLVIQQLRNENRWNVEQALKEMPDGLDKLYKQMLTQVRDLKRDSKLCLELLSTVNLAQRPLHILELGFLSGLPNYISRDIKSVRTLIRMCGSFLTIKGKQVFIIHQSAKDYLEANFDRFSQGLEEIGSRHLKIALRCIEAASATLKTNIYNLGYDESLDEIFRPQPDPLAPVRYACEFWVDHICLFHERVVEGSDESFSTDGPILKFLHEHFLHWLEALSLEQKLALSIPFVVRLLNTVQARNGDYRLINFLEDAELFIRRHGALIELYPRQLYSSALIFSPSESQIVQSQFSHVEKWIRSVSGSRLNEDAWRDAFHCGSESVHFCLLAFSSDSKLLATITDITRTIWIWEVATAKVAKTISLPVKPPGYIAFSPNSGCIALGGTGITLCDISSGNYSQAPNLETMRIKTMKFSRNGNTIVALARAITRYLVVVWDIKADTTRVIEDTFFNEKCITLDFNNVLIATDGSQNSRWDTHINSCDIESGVRLCAFLDTKNIFKTFTFSDNTIAVKHNGAYRERISILHASTGGHLRDLTVIENAPGTLKLAFTQNRKLLAALRVCQRELKLCIWDAIEGTLLYTINPPFSSGFEIAFSPNGDVLSCISEHGIIHILDMDTLLTQDNGNAGPLSLVVISPSGKLLVAASDRKLVVWDTSSQDEVQTFKNTSFVTSAILSPDDSKLAWISANKALVSEINRSDSEQLLGHSGSAKCIAFSSDSKIIASGSELSDGSGELSLWDTTTKACLWSFNTYAPVESVALSGDGKTIAVYEEGKGHDAKSWLCDVTNGCHRELKPLFMATVTSLVFSTDDSLLGLAESMPIGDMINLSLWDVSTGKRFKERFQVMVSLSCFALEGTHLTTSRGCAPSNSLAHGPCHGSRQQISTCSGLYVDEQWIYFKGRKCLRFPLNYRPSCVAVFGDLVVLGYDSGGWIWLRFQCAGDEIFEDDHRDYRSWYFECSEERSNPSEVSD